MAGEHCSCDWGWRGLMSSATSDEAGCDRHLAKPMVNETLLLSSYVF